MIPKIIHQTWKTIDIPLVMKNYVKSWHTYHPHYTHILWTDTDIREMIKKDYPQFLIYYDNYPHHIMRVDAFRFFVLHLYGGVYVDLDMEAYKCIDNLLEPKINLFLEHSESISNAIMAAPPQHPFLEHCMKQLMLKHKIAGLNTDAWEMTGPKFLTDVVATYPYPNDIKIFPAQYFFPIPWHRPRGDQSGQAHKYPLAYGAHHWQGTWWQPQNWRQERTLIIILTVVVILCILIFGLFLYI